MSRSPTTRRRLLQQTTGLAATAFAGPYMLTSKALGAPDRPAASNRITLGFIGVGGMGGGHLGLFLQDKDVEIRAIADVDRSHRERAARSVELGSGRACDIYNDFREILARPDIDAVVIAVPDHWHALAAISACRAGKDVYCEKPLSLTVQEARRIADTARQNGTVFQVGSQQRSSDNFRFACELVRSGRIGRLQWVRVGIGGGPVTGWEKPQPPPEGLDWDFWLGPAPWAEYTPKRCHGSFRWIYDYSGGKMTDWGAHHNDIAQWGIGASYSGPIRTEPMLAEFPTQGLFNTATRFEVKHTYANGVELFTCSDGNGVHFQGTDGWIKCNRGQFATSNPEIETEPLGAGDVHLYRVEGDSVLGHHHNWLDCIRTRQQTICPAEIGCRSVTVCHLGTIALRTGKTIHWDPIQERITNDESLNRWLWRPCRAPWHL